IRAACGLWKRNDLADVRLPGEEGDEPLDAEREPAVRRRPHAQRVEEPAELRLRLVIRHAHRPEHALLDLLPVDPDRAGAQLPAVPDQVVVLAERRTGIPLDELLVAVERTGEGMVHER